MPGIVGLISKMPRALAELQLLEMLKAISHEAFYNSGTWIDESLGVYVGWTALEGSFSDGMPLLSERGDTCLVFSGEEYSDLRTSHRAGSKEDLKGWSESGYLSRRYEEDRNFVQNLNGMFHGLIADRSRGVVTLFNDRFGMHRLCYYKSSDAFYFAPEAKAIVAARPELRTGDAQSLGEFVAFSCILENRTIFKNIKVLPAASAWTFKNAKLEHENTYFEPREWENQIPLTAESYYQELRSVLTTALPRYFAGRQPMGIAMTGGLDTRVILALHPSAPRSLPSYTFGGPFRESQDILVGRRIARICGQPHQVIQVSDDFLNNFADYAERCICLTEGTVDVARSADIYLSQRAGEIAPVKIVGTYGSEIVRHAVMFKPAHPPAGVFSPDLLSQVRDAGGTYSNLRSQHPVTFAAFRQSPWYHHGILALEQSQITVRSPFMDNEFVRTVYRAPRESKSNEDVRLRLINDGNAALGQIRSDRGVGGNGRLLSSHVVRAFQEFTFKAEYAYDYGMPQSVARIDHFFAALHLERLFLGRHKLLHFRVWYRDRLANYVRQILLDPRTLSRPYLERGSVEGIVDGHLKGTHNYTTEIHKLISLELLHRLFLDASN
jgi:asparagine synthase (glutamine-hydrolysing)